MTLMVGASPWMVTIYENSTSIGFVNRLDLSVRYVIEADICNLYKDG